MSSMEITKARKALETKFKSEQNLITGQLSEAKSMFDSEMEKLQKDCPHVWDSGEGAIEKVNDKLSICTICRKKIKN